MKHFFIFQIILIITVCIVACENKGKIKVKPLTQNVEFANHSVDSITFAKNISLSSLVKEHGNFNGQVIQTEGVVYFEFENVAICIDMEGDSKCFWLDLNRDLPVNDSLLQLASGQKFIIKGTVDNSSKGHLGAYLGTIRNVYYLKTK